MKNTEQTKALIEKYQAEYQAFMDVESFPKYRLELFEIQIDKVNQAGFGSVAQANYSPKTGEHILRICTNLELKKYVVFHEFTHILDAEMYAKNDAVKYAYLSGYTEYHASQVELMALLGAERIDMPLSFSPDLIIDTFPSKQNVLEYINSKHQFVVDMMSGSSFPADIEALKVTIGVLYNYFGLRSICKLFCKNYKEQVDNTSIIKYIPLPLYPFVSTFMDGWFDSTKVNMSFGPYSNIIMPLINEFKLI